MNDICGMHKNAIKNGKFSKSLAFKSVNIWCNKLFLHIKIFAPKKFLLQNWKFSNIIFHFQIYYFPELFQHEYETISLQNRDFWFSKLNG